MKITKTEMALSCGVLALGLIGKSFADDGAGLEKTISARALADALHIVLEADRAVYTKKVVNRLTRKDKVITASEHFDDDQALPLPAQMFRFGAETVSKQLGKQDDPAVSFSYSLQSLWPINKQNEPKTEAEKEGLQYVVDNSKKNYYTLEKLGGKEYFTAIYPDRAVSKACIICHNEHKDSPRDDFKMKETMGGVVIRILQQ